jgi:chitodextrinase
MAGIDASTGVAHADTIAPTVTSSAVLNEAAGTRSFTALTTAANDYLVVEAVLPGDDNTSLTASGGGLTYTKQIDTGSEATNTHLRHYVWTAPDAAGGSRTVRLTASGPYPYVARASVVHGSGGVGAHVANRTTKTVSVTRQGDHSMVFMSGGDWFTNPVGTPAWTPGGSTLTAVRGSEATYVFGRWDDSGTAATASHGVASGVSWTRPGMAVLEMKGALAADPTPPSTPGNLHVTATTTSSVSLAWDASTDNVGVTGYNVYRNGSQVAAPAGTSFTDTGLTAGTTYTYTVQAHDAAGNFSAASAPVDGTTQSGSSQCAPYPSFPDASCTGPTGQATMATYNGPMNITTAGTVIENVIINTAGMTVSANNVTFRNCKIIYSGTGEADYGLIEANPVTGTVFDHCEIDGKGLVKDGIHGGDNFTVNGCNIHDVGNGVEAGWAFTVKESYIWNIVSPAGYGWHADGIQAWDGTHDMLIDHNTVLMPAGEDGTVDFLGPSAQSNNLVQHNLLAGGGYSVSVGSSTSNTNVQIINNHYSTRYFPKVGYYDIYYYGDGETSGETVSGNVIDETGAPADHNI